MKKTLYVLICLLTAALVGTSCSLPALDSVGSLGLIGLHDIAFVSHTFDGTYSTWTYSVTSGTQPALSHWTISWCAPDAVAGASEYQEYAAPDPGTGITGIKFDRGYEDGETRTVSFTLQGEYPEGPVGVGTVAGGAVDYGSVWGPLCEPIVTYTITATAGIGGAIAPSGAIVVNEGDSQTFAVTSDTGYVIGDVLVDGGSVGAVSSYTFTDVTADHTIHVDFSVIQYTITASAGAGGNISPVGDVGVSHGGNQTFSITPNVGYVISDVLVDGGSVGAVSSYAFTDVTADHTIHVDFSVIQHTITASAGSGGSISPVGAVVVSHGQSQTFTIACDTGYEIGGVLVDGNSVGLVSSYTFANVTANHWIHAAFNLIQYTIVASAGDGGSISPDGDVVVNYGQDQTFDITSNTGYEINDILVDGIPVGMVASYIFENVTSDHTIYANFTPIQYTITASADVGGSISPVGDSVVSHGQSQGFTITPDAGYEIKDVLVDGASVGPVSSYTFGGVASNHTIHANFKLIGLVVSCYRLTVAVSPAGGGTATDQTGAACYQEGDIVAIRALATECYDFVKWTAPAGIFADAYAAETGFTMPGRDVTITANFEFAGNPTRALPDQVLPGEKFEVTVTFSAPYDGFHAIALTDVAPLGWDVSVNVAWADPEATAVHTSTAETAAYVWYGPYDVCVPFTTVYEVRVPVNAEPGTYTFSGSLKYYIEPHPAPPYEQEVTGDIQVLVKEGETVRIEGVTKEVDGAILPGAAVTLYQNGEAIGSVVSDESGNYEFEFSELGDYEVVVSKAGFRGEAQSILVTGLAIYTLDFVGDHGLIPDAPSMSYVLACISLWKFGEPPLQLSTSRILDVTSAWIYPIA